MPIPYTSRCSVQSVCIAANCYSVDGATFTEIDALHNYQIGSSFVYIIRWASSATEYAPPNNESPKMLQIPDVSVCVCVCTRLTEGFRLSYIFLSRAQGTSPAARCTMHKLIGHMYENYKFRGGKKSRKFRIYSPWHGRAVAGRWCNEAYNLILI